MKRGSASQCRPESPGWLPRDNGTERQGRKFMKLSLIVAIVLAATSLGSTRATSTEWGWCVRKELVCSRRVSGGQCMARTKRVRWISCPALSGLQSRRA
jgi:hypothetical protein